MLICVCLRIVANISADTGGAGGYLLFILPLSFITWYRPIYLGFSRTEGKAMAFFFCTSTRRPVSGRLTVDLYFIFAGFHLAFSTYMAVGIPCEFGPCDPRRDGGGTGIGAQEDGVENGGSRTDQRERRAQRCCGKGAGHALARRARER